MSTAEGVAKPLVSANSRSVANDPVAATPAEHYRLVGIGSVCACRGPWPCPDAIEAEVQP